MPGDATTKLVAGQLLTDKRYLSTSADDFQPLDGEFVRLMSGSGYDYRKNLPEIVDAIWHCDAYGLGESSFDVEAYNIDANGNHRLFYTGFERHELDYRPGTNQVVNKIKVNYDVLGKEFVMRHDHQRNVAQALHKDIDRTDVQQHPYDGRPSRHFRLRRQRRAIDQVSLGPGRLRSNQNDPRPLRARRSRPQRRSLLKRHNRIGSDRIDAAGHQRVAGRVRLRSCLGAAAVNENYDPTLDSGIGQLERLGWA